MPLTIRCGDPDQRPRWQPGLPAKDRRTVGGGTKVARDPNVPPTCGDCRHRSATTLCHKQTNVQRQLVHVTVDQAACELFEERSR